MDDDVYVRDAYFGLPCTSEQTLALFWARTFIEASIVNKGVNCTYILYWYQ